MFDIVNYNHNPGTPQIPSFFDLGGALAAAGFIGVVYQFQTPLWALVLRIRGGCQKSLIWILSGFGLFTMLIKALVFGTQMGEIIPLLQTNPVYFDVTAFVLFIMAPLSMVWFARQSKIFNIKRYKKFNNEIIKEISKGSAENIQAAFELTMSNLDAICPTIIGKHKDASQSARTMINEVLSDDSLVEILTTKRLDSLIYFFECLEKHKLDPNDLIVCMPKILRHLFLGSQSTFYKHLEMNGLAISSNIFKIFSFSHLTKNFNLFVDPYLSYLDEKEFKAIRVRVFVTALSELIKTYRNSRNIPSVNINSGLQTLSEIFRNLCLKISIQEKRGIDISYELGEEWEGLRLIADFLGKLEAFENRVIISMKTDVYDITVNRAFAKALSQAFEDLALIEDSYYIYHIIICLFDWLEFRPELTVGYKTEFEEQIWRTIAKNVTKRRYPASLRTYLIYFGMCLTADNFRTSQWMNDQLGKVRKLLYADLKPLLAEDAKMVNQKYMKDALLPQNMIYKDGFFAYIDRLSGEEVIIKPPDDISSVL